jgi:excisionase family DNA binding protein
LDTYTVKEVAKMMNTSEETVRRWIRSGKLKANMDSRKKGSVITDAMLREFTRNTPKYAAALANPIGGIVAASTLLLGTFVAKNIEKGEAIKNSTVDSEEIKKILKENLVTVNANKKKAIAQLEQEIVDEETKVKSLEYLLKNIENVKGDANE